jgi:hypothetical protein
VIKRARSIIAFEADIEATVICAPSLTSKHRHPVTPRCDSGLCQQQHHAECRRLPLDGFTVDAPHNPLQGMAYDSAPTASAVAS